MLLRTRWLAVLLCPKENEGMSELQKCIQMSGIGPHQAVWVERSFMVGLALRCIWPACSSRPASPAGQQGWARTRPGRGAVAQYGAWRRHVVMASPALDHTTLASSM